MGRTYHSPPLREISRAARLPGPVKVPERSLAQEEIGRGVVGRVGWERASSESRDAQGPRHPRPPPQVPPDQGRQGARRRRRPRQRAVDVHDADDEHQRDAAADRRADGLRLRHRARRRAGAGRRRRAAHHREEEPDPGHRRHPLPAEVRLPGDRRGLRGRARQPRQHPQVRRPGRRDREGGEGCRRQPAHRRQRRLARPAPAARSTARRPPRRSSRARAGRRACSRSTTSTTSRSRSSTTTPSSWCRPTGCSPRGATGRCTSA